MSAHERSGWRDEGLSRRHRSWGFNVPMCDVDFLVINYDRAMPVALIEYKKEPKSLDKSSPSIRAAKIVADRAKLYFFVVSYADDFSRWRVQAANQRAREYLWDRHEMIWSEQQYVTTLYALRGRAAPDYWIHFDERGRLAQ